MLKPYIILLLFGLAGLLGFVGGSVVKKDNYTKLEERVEILEQDTVQAIDTLIIALIYVESRGKEDAIGDTHLGNPSVGVLQIRPIMVREINRILKKQKYNKRFKLKDRFSREKSIEMFNIWREYYHNGDSYEKIARNWNGGPRGFKLSATRRYWNKVRKQISNQREELNEYKSIRRI